MANQPRATALIHTGALKHNYDYIRSLVRPQTKLCAMVKADAYGHGIAGVAKTLAQCGADYFGVAAMSEALEIRAAGIQTPILMMGYTAEEDIPLLWQKNITQTVYSLEYAKLLQSLAKEKIKCHLKLDTGMSRLGFADPDGCATAEMLEALACDRLDYEGVYTHFALSDEPQKENTARQFANFMSIVTDLERHGRHFALRHVSNSGAILNYPEMNLDMVRAGVMLYGMNPDGKLNPALRPVMEFTGTVEMIKTLETGTCVSYGGTYRCTRPTRVAVVSLGYADGVSRALSNRGELLVNGRRAPIVGKVCMDHLMIDVSAVDGVCAGMPAYLIGGGPNGVTADELAELEGTISYEIICRFVGSRVVKKFVD